MPKRSLVGSEKGIERAKYALIRKNWTQQTLADDVGVASWATISKFFNRIPISYNIFVEICQILDLDWQDIVAPSSPVEEPQQVLLTPLNQLWQQLQTLGSFTEQMGLVLVKEETLRWGWESQSRYEKSVRLGSYIRVEINSDTPGYLLLLQKDTAGQVWCFCPSCFAPQPYIITGKMSLPQEGSPLTSFPIEGTPGKEVILAVITEEIPDLNWLPQGNNDPLEVTENFLLQLLEFINTNPICKVMYTEYEIK